MLTFAAKDQIIKLREMIQARQPVISDLTSKLNERHSRELSKAAVNTQKTVSEDSIDKLAVQQCRLLSSLFLIRRRKVRRPSSRKETSSSSSTRPPSPRGSETSVGFSTLPDLTLLARHLHTVINYSVERLAYFCFYMAYYLQLTLPYTISLPQKSAPFTRISDNTAARGSSGKRVLVLRKSVKTVVQTSPRDFDLYAGGLAMLALDLSYIASVLGYRPNRAAAVGGNGSEGDGVGVEDVVQVDRTLMAVHEILTLTPNLHLELAGLPLWQTQRRHVQQPLPPGQSAAQAAVVSGPALPDLEDVVDHIITRNFVEINGGSAEWNMVDKDDDEFM